ncbi:MAG: response regulator [Spirochaetaceae bacterium]|nr:response regulator [Spirochaetaceae bacterium]
MASEAILCVDDEPIILMSLKRMLAAAFKGIYRIEIALCADEAFGLIEELRGEGISVRLVLSDWLMPGMKGDEFLTLLRERHPAIDSIMLTGQADEACLERARRDAALFACVRKPWRNAELLETIKACLEEPGADDAAGSRPGL